MKKWRCKVCGEIIESETVPEQCPRCKVKGDDKFEEVVDNRMSWAAEHVLGVAKDAPEAIKEGLRANFHGECSEVGMYLAMARVAAREGYPEIAMYWEKAQAGEKPLQVPLCTGIVLTLCVLALIYLGTMPLLVLG